MEPVLKAPQEHCSIRMSPKSSDEFPSLDVLQPKPVLPVGDEHTLQRGFLIERKAAPRCPLHQGPETLGKSWLAGGRRRWGNFGFAGQPENCQRCNYPQTDQRNHQETIIS